MDLLDLKQAYDRIPRTKLWEVLSTRLPTPLENEISPLLFPIRARTQGQTDDSCATLVAGDQQGDPLSPLLFDIFMDTFLGGENHMNGLLASCFADDVALMATTPTIMQKGLEFASSWVESYGMQWNFKKSHTLWNKHPFQLSSQPLPQVSEAEYLGISLKNGGIGHSAVITRIKKAQDTLCLLIRETENWQKNPKDRRKLVKSFIWSQVDYMLALQPITPTVLQAAMKLEKAALGWILATKINPNQLSRASAIALLPSIWTRRFIKATSVLTKFKGSLVSNSGNPLRRRRNYLILTQYGTLKPLLAGPLQGIPTASSYESAISAGSTAIAMAKDIALRYANANVRRQIPISGKQLPPALRSHMGRLVSRRAIIWYLNRLPARSENHREALPRLKTLLERNSWTEDHMMECQELLYRLDSEPTPDQHPLSLVES